jgi:glutathione S-transferase
VYFFCTEQYLEDKYPQHPLLPKDPRKKALDLQVYGQLKILDNSTVIVLWSIERILWASLIL